MYISRITFPTNYSELDAVFSSEYPYVIMQSIGIRNISFKPINIFYGNNGSGKSTLLNIIASKVGINRQTVYNKSECFHEYVALCELDKSLENPEQCAMIASDDVFDYMLDVRNINQGIDTKREDICQEYLSAKYATFRMNSLSDYEQLKLTNESRGKTYTKYHQSRLMNHIKECSNGETAFKFFVDKIQDNGLYILDEPENSLSPKKQLELKKYIEDSVRFFGCQFLISTHSPFLLALEDALVYDLDECPAAIKHWKDLDTIRLYNDFFKAL